MEAYAGRIVHPAAVAQRSEAAAVAPGAASSATTTRAAAVRAASRSCRTSEDCQAPTDIRHRALWHVQIPKPNEPCSAAAPSLGWCCGTVTIGMPITAHARVRHAPSPCRKSTGSRPRQCTSRRENGGRTIAWTRSRRRASGLLTRASFPAPEKWRSGAPSRRCVVASLRAHVERVRRERRDLNRVVGQTPVASRVDRRR